MFMSLLIQRKPNRSNQRQCDSKRIVLKNPKRQRKQERPRSLLLPLEETTAAPGNLNKNELLRKSQRSHSNVEEKNVSPVNKARS